MENNESIEYLLEKTGFFHDCNFEKIEVIYRKYSEDAPVSYPKDKIDITLFINLADNQDKNFANKTLKIGFIDVQSYSLVNTSVSRWIFNEARNEKVNKMNMFFIDDVLQVIYETCKWEM